MRVALLAGWVLAGACGGDAVSARDADALAADQVAVDGAEVEEVASDAVVDVAPVDAEGEVAEDALPDADAPTVDALDADADGDAVATSDGAEGGDAAVEPEPVWDLARIRDASTAECTFTNERTALKDGVLLDLWNVSYRSWESVVDAEGHAGFVPITIRGFAARPASASAPLPGVVQAHGLGGMAKEDHATGPAALLGVFVIAYTGPGGGDAADNTSEGRPAAYDDGRRMFDTIPDPRGSWFWGHAVAAMRALTCLEHRPDVDPTRLGMTGFSAGGVATLTVAGVDDRIIAAVPLSGTLAWDVAVASPSAWQRNLLALAGLTTESPEWQALMTLLAPQALLGGTHAAVLMADGTADEFFPLTAFEATFGALGAPLRRRSLAANFDHGCYAVSGLEDPDTVSARADLRARGGQRAFFGHAFGTDARFATIPAEPTLALTPAAAATLAVAAVDESADALEVAKVTLWASTDDALTWVGLDLARQSAGAWGAIVPTPAATTLAYVDVEYTTGELVGATRFSLSSAPIIPVGHVPRIRGMTNCLPP